VSVEENNQALVRRFNEEVYNRGNMDVADELLAPNFVSRDALTGEEASREDLKQEMPSRQPFLQTSTSALRSRSPRMRR
jgi:hypothetical protein